MSRASGQTAGHRSGVCRPDPVTVAALVRQATLGQDAAEPLVVLDGVFADEIERLGAALECAFGGARSGRRAC